MPASDCGASCPPSTSTVSVSQISGRLTTASPNHPSKSGKGIGRNLPHRAFEQHHSAAIQQDGPQNLVFLQKGVYAQFAFQTLGLALQPFRRTADRSKTRNQLLISTTHFYFYLLLYLDNVKLGFE